MVPGRAEGSVGSYLGAKRLADIARHRGDPNSIPGRPMLDLWWIEWLSNRTSVFTFRFIPAVSRTHSLFYPRHCRALEIRQRR